MHLTVTIDADISENYWNGWWESLGVDGKNTRTLRSLRSGRDAEYDLEVLTGRLASGLHRLPVVVS